MKYFVGYLIRGAAAQWHIDTAKEISEKFNTWKIHQKIPPHLTIFYLDELENIDPVRNFLKEWSATAHVVGNFHLNGFDRFDDKVVFAKVEADNSIFSIVKNLRKEIKDITGITKEEFSHWHPHATLANRLPSEEIEKIWKYTMNLEKPDFTIPFDNVTIFEYAGDREWKILESFALHS
jgi:2'-5' RNA ligase